MKNELLIKTNEQAKTIDSRDVAEMMEKTHGDLLKDIQGSGKNLGIIPVLTKGNFPVVDYFIESSYVDGKGETRKCYLCTKLGCDMLGNKLRGEKGILPPLFSPFHITFFLIA
jgi:phage regulator Rha-like protein